MSFFDDLNNRVAHKQRLVSEKDALKGRDEAIKTAFKHFVFDRELTADYVSPFETIVLGLGCFWGAERKFWQQPGVYLTAVGYSGGYTKNPSYEEVCTGKTGHTEVVKVVFEPELVSLEQLLTVFWESHDPTQGMRQGNDMGTQYRSGIYVFSEAQKKLAKQTLLLYQQKLTLNGYGEITTEICDIENFYYAESYHQQYLAKNPDGYCGLGGTGVNCS